MRNAILLFFMSLLLVGLFSATTYLYNITDQTTFDINATYTNTQYNSSVYPALNLFPNPSANDATTTFLWRADGNNASINGTLPVRQVGVTWVGGKFDGGANITNGVMMYPAAGNANLDTGTLEVWIRKEGNMPPTANGQLLALPSNVTNNQSILAYILASAGNNYLRVYFYNSSSAIQGLCVTPHTDGGSSIQIWNDLDNTTFHFLAIGWNSSATGATTQRCCWDGLCTDVSAIRQTGLFSLANISLGSNNLVNPVNATFDDIRISNYEKSKDEIYADYQAYNKSGTYSKVIDSNKTNTCWNNITFQNEQPYNQNLENNMANESNTVLNGIDMTNNTLLWHLDSSWLDGSGNNNNASCSSWVENVSQNCPSNATGLLQGAMSFNYSNHEALKSDTTIPDNSPYGNTISMWIYPTSIGTFNQGIGGTTFWASGTSRMMCGFQLNTAGTVTLYRAIGATSGTVTSTSVLKNNIWYHIAGFCSNTSSKLYINGLSEGTWSTTTVPITTSNFYTGVIWRSGIEEFFNGTIDESSIWNGEMSAASIWNIYLRGAGAHNVTISTCNTSLCDGTVSTLSVKNQSPINASTLTCQRYMQINSSLWSLHQTRSPEIDNYFVNYTPIGYDLPWVEFISLMPPPPVTSADTIEFWTSFGSNNSLTATGNCTLWRNGTSYANYTIAGMSNNTLTTIATYPPFTFNAGDVLTPQCSYDDGFANSTTVNGTNTTILGYPTALLISPTNNYATTNTTLDFYCNATDYKALQNVTIFIDAWSYTNTTSLINGTYHWVKGGFSTGWHSWHCMAFNSDNLNTTTSSWIFYIVPPSGISHLVPIPPRIVFPSMWRVHRP